MKNEVLIIFMGFLVVFGLAFLIYSFEGDSPISGLVIHNESEVEEIEGQGSENISANSTVGEAARVSIYSLEEFRERVIIGINDSILIIAEMEKNNFSLLYITDKLIEARILLEQVDFAEILRSDTATDEEKLDARVALRYVEWENLNYRDVIEILDEIKERKELGFYIYDSIGAAEINLAGYVQRGINVSKAEELLSDARFAFYEDRYEDSIRYLDDIREDLKSQTLAFSTLRAIRRALESFFEKYWKKYWYVFVFAFVLMSVFIHFVYREIKKRLLVKKIKRLRMEKRVVKGLMKRTQKERYKLGKISGIVYEIRMKKYQDKLGKIDELIPVLETKLDKLTFHSGYLSKRGKDIKGKDVSHVVEEIIKGSARK